jgi:hypothetical protein
VQEWFEDQLNKLGNERIAYNSCTFTSIWSLTFLNGRKIPIAGNRMKSARYCCPIWTNIGMCRQILVKLVKISMSIRKVTGYGLDDRGSILGRVYIFVFSTASRPALGPTQPPVPWRWRDRSVKLDESPPCTVENAWSITSTSIHLYDIVYEVVTFLKSHFES